jgi:hypothetical protein
MVAVLSIAGCAPLLDRNRVCRWGAGGSGEPHVVRCRPPPLFIAQCDEGPPTANRLSVPDQGTSQGPSGRWAILVGDQPNKEDMRPPTEGVRPRPDRVAGGGDERLRVTSERTGGDG